MYLSCAHVLVQSIGLLSYCVHLFGVKSLISLSVLHVLCILSREYFKNISIPLPYFVCVYFCVFWFRYPHAIFDCVHGLSSYNAVFQCSDPCYGFLDSPQSCSTRLMFFSFYFFTKKKKKQPKTQQKKLILLVVYFQHTMFSHHMIIKYRSEQVKTFPSVDRLLRRMGQRKK